MPFLFTLKEFTGKGNTSQFGGDFTVPRTAARPSSTLRAAVAPPATTTPWRPPSDADEFLKENNKNAAAPRARVLNVAKYDAVTGEIAGVFESIQPSDTDLGSKAPKDVKITGLWYAQLQ